MIQATHERPAEMGAGHPSRRSRVAAALGVAIVALVLLMGAHGLDWDEGPAMVLGEVIGLLTPLAAFVLAAMALHAVWNRFAAR